MCVFTSTNVFTDESVFCLWGSFVLILYSDTNTTTTTTSVGEYYATTFYCTLIHMRADDTDDSTACFRCQYSVIMITLPVCGPFIYLCWCK